MPLTPLQRNYLVNELADRVGREHVLTSEEDRTIYGVEYFWIPRMYVDRGATPPLPDVVVLPGSAEEVAAVLKLANIHRVPVVPWGGGSGSQGGTTPIHGGITLDLKRLNRIVEINSGNLSVTAQAGINGYELERALNQRGFTLGHIPASIHSATLGGYLACRGSGVVSNKYGKIEDIVMAMEVVLPQGDVMRTLPVPSHASGPGILQLFVGAEGSYGVITEATCRVEPRPETRVFRAFVLPDFSAAFQLGRRAMVERITPALIRLYDEHESQIQIRKILGHEVEGAYIVFGFMGDAETVAWQGRKLDGLLEGTGARELPTTHARAWWDNRYTFFYPPRVLDFPKMFGTMDTLCTFDKLEHLYRTKKRTLEEKYARWNLHYIAHLSHWFPWGAMIYDRFIIEQPPFDLEEAHALHDEVWNTAVRTTLACGGVINEHHGVGLKLGRFVREQYGPAFAVLEALKNGLDPHHVLNPGKMGFGPAF